MDSTLEEFAAAVGTTGPVSIAGDGTRGVNRDAAGDGHVVRAPSGIVRVDAAEMVVECGAATPVNDVLAALGEVGQTVSIAGGGTIGGALAVGRSDITRLGHGPMRDVLLQTHYVSAAGKLTKAGGPTVKNVSGFDLCRLFVGSYGTLGFFGDMILRTRPLPRNTTWFTSDGDPFILLAELFRPVSILWDGTTTWVRLDGDERDVAATVAQHGLVAVDGPPALPSEHRWSLAPAALQNLTSESAGTFVAEIGVGVVHHSRPQARDAADGPTSALHGRIKAQFDPTGRLNPGVDPLHMR